MKRADVVIGTEYAEHGPLAYGRVPNQAPAKVRFTSLEPNHRAVTVYVVTGVQDEEIRGLVQRRVYGEPVRRYITDDWHHLPTSWYAAKVNAREGDVIDVVEAVANPRGAIPGERFIGDEWKPNMILPAAVHMTWAEHEAKQEATRVEQYERAVRNAPTNFDTALRDLVRNARLMGWHDGKVLTRVEEYVNENL